MEGNIGRIELFPSVRSRREVANAAGPGARRRDHLVGARAGLRSSMMSAAYDDRESDCSRCDLLDLDPVDLYARSPSANPVGIDAVVRPGRNVGSAAVSSSPRRRTRETEAAARRTYALPLDADLTTALRAVCCWPLASLDEANKKEPRPVARRRQEPEPVGDCLQAVRAQAA